MSESETSGICELCQGQRYTHYIVGWKHTAWPCPVCNREAFSETTGRLHMNPDAEERLIRTIGKPGSGE